MKKIAYVPLLAEVFHYGHLNIIRNARSVSEYVVIGVLADCVVSEQRGCIISTFNERFAVVNELKSVDEVMVQEHTDPTENLMAIRKKHPKAKILLFYADSWGKNKIPGLDYIKSIGGEIVRPKYYDRLSIDKIREGIMSYEMHTDKFKVENIKYKTEKSLLSTKAETLWNFKNILKKSKIEDIVFFDIEHWKTGKNLILEEIKSTFGSDGLVVRSSCLSEDAYSDSKAGHFHSVLGVTDPEKAIEKVISVYDKKDIEYEKNQVLVQRQTKDIAYSGVILSRILGTDAPFFSISFDISGSTDSITSGKEDQKIEIIRNIDTKDCPYPWNFVIDAVREIETHAPNVPLDIEFAVNADSEVIIFQIRPLVANRVSSDVTDEEIFAEVDKIICGFKESNSYSDMSFWNPAEIIGTHPNRLDYSLYRYIITKDVWNRSLVTLGYTKVDDELMVKFGGKPYIDLKNTFRTLLPSDLSEPIKARLIDFYLHKLYSHPELHDKVEFKLVHNSYDYSWDKKATELLENGFSRSEIREIELSLQQLTDRNWKKYGYWLNEADVGIQVMEGVRKATLSNIDYSSPKSIITAIETLLNSCIDYGTVQFSRIARLAFMGNEMLKSMVESNLIYKEYHDDFLASISTVASEFDGSDKYGHLRPGTYDITSLRYDQMPKMSVKPGKKPRKPKALAIMTHKKKFIINTTIWREKSKFEFTKNLSDAIELIAKLGELLGFSREDMSQLDIETIISSKDRKKPDLIELYTSIIKERRRLRYIHDRIILPPILFSKNDLKIIPTYIAEPNFITDKMATGETVFLNSKSTVNIDDKIVLITNADPGYDWIFSKRIRGLITCYGGVASHMAIRCAEFGLPAAIGIGGKTMETIKSYRGICLDCKEKKISEKTINHSKTN